MKIQTNPPWFLTLRNGIFGKEGDQWRAADTVTLVEKYGYDCYPQIWKEYLMALAFYIAQDFVREMDK